MSDLLAERGSDIKQMHGVLSIQVIPCTARHYATSTLAHMHCHHATRWFCCSSVSVTRRTSVIDISSKRSSMPSIAVSVQGYGSHGTHFKFEGAQQTVRFGPTVGSATDSKVTFSGHQLCAKVSYLQLTVYLLQHLVLDRSSTCLSACDAMLCLSTVISYLLGTCRSNLLLMQCEPHDTAHCNITEAHQIPTFGTDTNVCNHSYCRYAVSEMPFFCNAGFAGSSGQLHLAASSPRLD